MRKLWLVLTLVTAFTVAAVAAQAASVPSRLNGSSWNYTAFQMTESAAAPSVAYGTMLNSTYNSTGDGGLFGSLETRTAAGVAATFTVDLGDNATQWQAGQSFAGANNTASLLGLDFIQDGTNATSALYFINNPTQSLFVSFGNETLGDAAGVNGGPHLGLMVQNLTITNNVTDVAGTWYFYSLEGTNASNLVARAGAMVLTSTGAAGSMSYASLYNNGSSNGTTTDTATWGKVDGGAAININGTAAGILCDKAFLSRDKKIVVGYTAPSGAGNVRTLIALKSGSTFSSSDFADTGMSSIKIANNNSTLGTNLANATLDVFYTSSTGAITAGNTTGFSGKQTLIIDSLAGRTVTVGSTTLGGVTQSTMKLSNEDATFLGRKVSNIYAGLTFTNGAVGLKIFAPAAAQVNAPVAASTAEVNTFNTSFTVTGTSGAAIQVFAGTEVSPSVTTVGTSGSNLGTLVSQFENATDTELATQFSLGSATIDRNFPTVNFVVNLGAGNAGNMTVRKISFAGNNKLISELPIPTKFYVEKVTTAAGTVHAMNSTKAFTYRNAGAAITDGSYWITPSGFPALTLNYSDANKLALGSNYDMWLAILDDGDYDLDPTDAQIADPSSFVSGLGGGGGIGGSSSDSGCVLNPAAGFSMELVLLMLAPLAYFIRRRKK